MIDSFFSFFFFWIATTFPSGQSTEVDTENALSFDNKVPDIAFSPSSAEATTTTISPSSSLEATAITKDGKNNKGFEELEDDFNNNNNEENETLLKERVKVLEDLVAAQSKEMKKQAKKITKQADEGKRQAEEIEELKKAVAALLNKK